MLNVRYDNWLLVGGDLKQNYIGWKSFRESDWASLIGLHDTISYPEKISIIFTDSIPIMAIICKIISPILPYPFQYFGIWGLICFFLQAGLSAVITYKMTQRKVMSIIGAFFCVFCITFLQRMFTHTALAGHFLILLGIYLWLCFDKGTSIKAIAWGGIGMLCASIHMYFLPMIGVLLCGSVIEQFINSKKWKTLILIPAYSFSAVFTIFILGGFATSKSMIGDGGSLGEYSANLNGLFNSQGVSNIIQGLHNFPNQYEGLCYLGAGVIFLAFLCIFPIIVEIWENPKLLKKNMSRIISVAFVVLTLMVIAISPKVTFGQKIIVNLILPEYILNLWSTFYSTGRFMWPIMYLIFFAMLYALKRYYSYKQAMVLLLIGICLQYSDVTCNQRASTINFNTKVNSVYTTFNSENWKILNQYKHIVVMGDDYDISPTNLLDLTNFALDNNVTISRSHFAHAPISAEQQIETNKQNIMLSKVDDDTCYIFSNHAYPYDLLRENKLNFYKMDDFYIIGVLNPISDLQGLNINYEVSILPRNGEYIDPASGIDDENGRKIYSHGQSCGPYIKIPAGQYKVKFYGKNLDKASFAVNDYIKGNIAYTNMKQTNDYVELDFQLLEDYKMMEFKIINDSSDDIYVNDIKLLIN